MASQTTRIPVSQVIKDVSNEEEEPKKKSREDWRRAKELEEARKAGTAPAAVDEEGRDINPHIPQYISNAPWYYGSLGPTLKHQRPQDEKHVEVSGINEWYRRGVDTGKVITKYRKGACDNCGAMTHKKIDCMERPRKIGAKFSGAQIAHDEFVQPNIVADYDGKRDRWSGYDPAAHREIIEEYKKVEDAKQQIKADKLKDNTNAELSDDEEDEDKYVDEVDMPGTKVDSKQRITVRNLRIREDTAKYLRNLDPNSAYYDPKTRSMRDNPNPQVKTNESDFCGENFVRFGGDTTKHSKAQLFAWEAYGKGVDVHLLAEPTKLELLQHEYEKKKEQFKSETKDTILDKYGGDEHLQVPPKSLLLAQTEEYIEYSRSGKVIKGQEKQTNRSIYEEDVLINNHTSVWGSWWLNGTWGYKCCHSSIKSSYCVGEAGINVQQDGFDMGGGGLRPDMDSDEDVADKTMNETAAAEHSSDNCESEPSRATDDLSRKSRKKNKKNKKKKLKEKRKSKDKSADTLDDALMAEDKHIDTVRQMMSVDERKRPYNSMFEVKQPTENEVEAYLMKRRRDEDPMLQFIEK